MQRRDSEPIINPFSFPAETDGRFTMLAVSAMLIALYTSLTSTSIMLVVAQPLLTGDLPWMLYAVNITAAIMNGSDALSVTDAQLRQLAEALPVVYIYALLFSLPRLALSTLLLFVLLGLAWALYRIHPAWTRRRQQLRILPEFPHPERARALESLVQSAAVTAGVAPPTIMVRRHPQNDAAIFGTRGRYILRLNAWPLGAHVDELDELDLRDEKQVHTQILHELGHIVNNDVWRSRAAQAIWGVFIWLVTVPMALATVYFVILQIGRLLAVAEGEQLGQVLWAHSEFLSFTLQLIALVLVVRASHAALLRIREFYADWRAVLWGARDQITTMLCQKVESEQEQPRSGRWSALVRFWQRLWDSHPPARDRLAHIENPLLLFRVSSDLAFHTGILLAFMTVGMMAISYSIGSSIAQVIELSIWMLIRLTIDLPAPLNRQAYLAIIVMMRLIVPLSLGLSVLLGVVYLIVGSMGRQMQRAAVADLLPASGRPWGYMGLWRVAFLLALGQEFGFLILPRSAFVIRDLVSLLLIPLWIVIFSTLIWFWLVYVRAFSQRMLGTHSGRHLPRAKHWLVSGCTSAALLLLYFPVVAGRVLIVNAPLLADSSTPFQQLTPDIPLAYLFGSITLLLLLGAIALFMLWTVVTLSIAYLWSIWRRPVCPRCGLQSRELLAVGRRCSNCYTQLAPWLFVPPRRSS